MIRKNGVEYLKKRGKNGKIDVAEAIKSEDWPFTAITVMPPTFMTAMEIGTADLRIRLKNNLELTAPIILGLPESIGANFADAEATGKNVAPTLAAAMYNACSELGSLFDGNGAEPTNVALWSPCLRNLKKISEKAIIKIRLLSRLPPHTHLDLEADADIAKHIEMLEEVAPNAAIAVEINTRTLYEDVVRAVSAGASLIFVNEFGTSVMGASGYGVPSLGTLTQARSAINDVGEREAQLVVVGDFRTSTEIFKAIALGADIVCPIYAPLIALGDLLGEKAAKPSKTANVEAITTRITNMYRAIIGELRLLVSYTGHKSVKELSDEDLRAITYDLAAITGLKLAGYNKKIPLWQH